MNFRGSLSWNRNLRRSGRAHHLTPNQFREHKTPAYRLAFHIRISVTLVGSDEDRALARIWLIPPYLRSDDPILVALVSGILRPTDSLPGFSNSPNGTKAEAPRTWSLHPETSVERSFLFSGESVTDAGTQNTKRSIRA